MWDTELKELYTETWGPSSPVIAKNTRGVMPPKETHDSIKMRGVFGAGDSPSNLLAISQASGQNPYEQEEAQLISKNSVIELINNALETLDSNSTLDQSGVFAIGQLKSEIEKL